MKNVKKCAALVLVVVLMAALAGCGNVMNLQITDPDRIMLRGANSGVAVELSDPGTVETITTIVNALPLQKLDVELPDAWSYEVRWLNADGDEIAAIAVSGVKIIYQGAPYTVGPGLDLTPLTEYLESLPELSEFLETAPTVE